MTKYLLADRELNGPSDSDFYAVFWDTEKQEIRSEFYGTTRCAAPTVAPVDEYPRDIPESELEKAREYFKASLFEILKNQDIRERDKPQDASRGDLLAVLDSGTFKDKKRGTEVEYQAGETGTVIWVGTFNKIYRNGYNKRDRSTLRVGLKFEDERVIFVDLEKCRQAREYKSNEELERASERIAKTDRFHILFNYHGFIKF